MKKKGIRAKKTKKESAAIKASNTAKEKSKVNPGKEAYKATDVHGTLAERQASPGIETGSHRLGANPPRKMSQKTILSYFGKSASKKVEGVESEAKTKNDKRKSISVERDAEDTSKKLRSEENQNHKFPGDEKKNLMESSAEPLIASGLGNLAPEILITIFGFLPFDDLKRATLVCRFVLRFSLRQQPDFIY